MIVTRNLRHFPRAALEPLGLHAISPDDFLLDLYDLAPEVARQCLAEQAESTSRPPMSVDEVLNSLALAGAPIFADQMRTPGDMEEPHFARVVDALLNRIHDGHGHSPEGRGGDRGIDYSVDDNRIIYQYKFFPDGKIESSQIRQITGSFKSGEKHGPEEWRLVVPAKVTHRRREQIMALGDDSGVRIQICDLVWLDSNLSKHPDLAVYFRHRSDNDYLVAKAELFQSNPIVRHSDDIATKTAAIKQAIDEADPNWTFDISTEGTQVTQVLRPKHANAASVSPISINWSIDPSHADTEAVRHLRQSLEYGMSEAVRLDGTAVQNLRIDGPELVRYVGDVRALELLPAPNSSSPFRASDLIVTSADGRHLGTHLGESRILARGAGGLTIQFQLGDLVELRFRCPDNPTRDGQLDFKSADVSEHPIPDVVSAWSLVRHLGEHPGAIAELLVDGTSLLLIQLPNDEWGWNENSPVLELAEDLDAIERATGARFRFPSSCSVADRLWTRCVRLLLEGHVVAHPTKNSVEVEFTDTSASGVAKLLQPEPGWCHFQQEAVSVQVLDQDVELEQIAWGGPLRPAPEELPALRSALDDGSLVGRKATLTLADEDRVRMWMPGRLVRKDLAITPWGIAGIEQPVGTLAAAIPQ